MPIKKISNLSDNNAINIALDTINLGKQALVFVNTKRSAEKTAEDISKKIKIGDDEFKAISEEALKALSKPTKQCERLAFCLKKGIAFHHAGLVSKQRNLIEENFRNGAIKIICATPTLAFGLDLPAFRAIIKDLRRYTQRGLTWIPVLEYLQQAGRAGRPKFDKFGEAIIIAGSEGEKDKIHEMYILGQPEDIYSKLAVEPVLRTYLLSLISANFIRNKKQIMDFFERTFWAFQYKDIEKLDIIISKMLDFLEDWEFIKGDKEDFKNADEIESEAINATIMGKRVAELYIDPLTASFIIRCLRNSSDKKRNEFSFLQMVSSTLEMRPLLRVGVKENEKIQEQLVKFESFLLEEEPSMYDPEYGDFLNSIKTSLMFNDWVNEKDEEFLLEEYNIRPGELKVKLDNADWLLYTSEEICRILQFQSLIKEIVKLRLRIKYGVKEELLPLLKLSQIGRVRARKLFRNKIKDIKDVKNSDLGKLVQILGEKVALNVKKQVGEEVKEIPKGKRKGQISLTKY
jgi:helicase